MASTHVARYCARARALVLDEIERLAAEQTPVAPLRAMMLDYPLREAKALRPAICLATCRALGGSLQAALPSAVAFELLHNAFLIHDDVEDESLFRRGEPTLQRAHGSSIAMNVADAMLALALTPLLHNTEVIGLGPALRVLDQVRRTVLVTVEGQAIELGWIRDNTWHFEGGHRQAYEELVLKKTAVYSFVSPVRVGVIAADAREALAEPLARYAEHLGIAFQITDDLLNLRDDVGEYGKEACGDLWEGKRTLMLLHALHRARGTEDGRRALEILAKPRPLAETPTIARTLAQLHAQGHLDDTALAALTEPGASTPAKTAEEVRYLLAFVRRHGGLELAREVAREHTAQAQASLAEVRGALVAGPDRELLEELTTYVIERLR